MKAFTYLRPGDGAEAVAMLREHGPDARIIAGGQSLLLALKDRSARPPVLVSLRGLPELSGVRADGDELVVGATTTYADLTRTRLPGWQATIAAVAGDLADRPVRTMGTIGGALCAADPRYDALTLVTGVGARLEVLSADGLRVLQPAEFFAPGGGTLLEPGEVLTAVRFPGVAAWDTVVFEKFRTRVFDAALASVLCAVRVDPAGTLTEVRLTVGAAVPVPVVALGTGSALVGSPAVDVDLDAVARAVVTEVLSDRDDSPTAQYARELVAALTRRALLRALPSPRS
ncbi:MAG TPA: FAD binding domain-containing protein [Modestobacter sp.]|nr:FAD binding domain-containing protein [Modestobacter sp.]